ncbi:MAG: D-isomer specific 2-hydroxyacid dehydrogenase family protein [Acidimicrobiia bacterium]|nr:D-isomer specific 2-hydroxyacid dehydrogenase family protein [Acidimicrobiia bacterium]MCY4435326.1 D-isomer specific 2-hydroxyacid dehydrogenase family protein [bacterium]
MGRPNITPPSIAVEPDCWRRPALVDAVTAGGGLVVDPSEAEALVWAEPAAPDLLPEVLAKAPGIEWVQLPYAGIENLTHLLDNKHLWTCGKGVYAEPVAEHVLMLALAGLRGMASFAQARSWSLPEGRNLLGGRVTVLGGGGITESLARLLAPWDCRITVLRRHPKPMPGVYRVVGPESLHDALSGADVVVVALALTPETTGIIDADALSAMQPHAWLINVGRGRHVITEDLVASLAAGTIGGAALDVTDPEPLPDGHPLWGMDNCLITPHVGNTPEMGLKLLARRVTENIRRYIAGEELLGPVDVDLGY